MAAVSLPAASSCSSPGSASVCNQQAIALFRTHGIPDRVECPAKGVPGLVDADKGRGITDFGKATVTPPAPASAN